MQRTLFHGGIAVSFLLLVSVPVAAEPPEPASGNPPPEAGGDRGSAVETVREEFVLLENGATLLVRTLSSAPESTLVRRNLDGSEDVLSGGEAIGAGPDMNASGAAAFKGTITEPGSCCPSDPESAIFVADGGLSTIITSANNGNGDPAGSGTVCQLEPMPVLNDIGQVAFGGSIDESGGDNLAECGAFNNTDLSTDERKAAFRAASTRGAGVSVLLETNRQESVSTADGFDITDVDLTHEGGRIFNDSGQVAVDVLLDDDATDDPTGVCGGDGCSVDETESDDRFGLMRLNDVGDRDLIAHTDPPGGMFQELAGEVINSSGTVMFKGTQASGGTDCGFKGGSCGTETGTQLYLWNDGTGSVAIASSGDSARGGGGTFEGFTPHFDLNDSGEAAFVAGLANVGSCGSNPGAGCNGVYFHNGSSNIEIARTTDANPGAFTSSFNGFDFGRIGSVAALEENGSVYFVAENFEATVCDTGNADNDDGGEFTAVFRWTAGEGLSEIIREGQTLEDGSVITQLAVPMPGLRDHGNNAGGLAISAEIDPDGPQSGDCDATENTLVDEIILGGLVDVPAIPTLSRQAMVVLVLLLAGLAGLALVNARRAG